MTKKIPEKKIKITLLILGVFLSLIIILGCFYISKNIEIDNKDYFFRPRKEDKVSSVIKNFGIKIDKINVFAPIVKNVDGANKNIYKRELKKGVAHMKGTAFPGEGSNIFIFGHSSSEIGWGKYAKIFAKLGELKVGENIIIYYKNKKYHYEVFDKEIIEKTEISVTKPTKKEQLTLMTCWPIGTAKKRLIIKAKLPD
ncbi:MAG: class D sortase [Candidatus Pacebacteria bacterium]|nr:class D sortase [Candidatus Paceibacterota bacterium]